MMMTMVAPFVNQLTELQGLSKQTQWVPINRFNPLLMGGHHYYGNMK